MKQLVDVSLFDSIPNQYKTQEMCNTIICKDHISIRCVPDQYKTQQMCDKTVDDCLAALIFVPDWLVTRKIIALFGILNLKSLKT